MTPNLLLEPTIEAQWKHILEQAEHQSRCQLDEELESYLIFTLIRFTQNPQLAVQALAPEYLQQFRLKHHASRQQLRDIGDQCLLISGLFPQRAEKRLVRVSYYVDMGRSAYQHLSTLLKQAFARLYQHLSHNFVPLMDVLQNIRPDPALLPLQAFELWQDTGSAHARALLSQSTNAIPVCKPNANQH